MDNKQSVNEGLRELALFAGAGGGILGGKLLGWRTVCAVEWEPYPASVLCSRQNDGILPPFPIWDDVCTFDGKPWRGLVDVVSGGFPCQDISIANVSGNGIDGERSGMWREMARVICEVRPKYAFIENSPILTSRGLDRVLCDLAKIGFDVAWAVVSAASVGAPHKRDRLWIVCKMANPDTPRLSRCKQLPNNSAQIARWQESSNRSVAECVTTSIGSRDWFDNEPNVGRVANGVASRVDRLKSIGNGQVPLCAAIAWNILLGELT